MTSIISRLEKLERAIKPPVDKIYVAHWDKSEPDIYRLLEGPGEPEKILTKAEWDALPGIRFLITYRDEKAV